MSRNAGNGEYGNFDEILPQSQRCDKFGKISSNCQMHANKLNTWRPAMLADLTILANVTNLAKFHQIAK